MVPSPLHMYVDMRIRIRTSMALPKLPTPGKTITSALSISSGLFSYVGIEGMSLSLSRSPSLITLESRCMEREGHRRSSASNDEEGTHELISWTS